MPVKYTKDIVCLANSRKTTGRCLAGKEITGQTYGGWIRPISGRPTDLNFEVGIEGAAFNNAKRKVRGIFTLGGSQYKLAVTDPVKQRHNLFAQERKLQPDISGI